MPKARPGPGSRSQAAKTSFSSGAFVTAIKNATHLVKGYWDRSLQPSLAWKVAREKKTILRQQLFQPTRGKEVKQPIAFLPTMPFTG